MEYLYLFIGIYIIVFSIYMIYFFFRNKKKLRRKMIEELYLEKSYKLNLSNVNYSILCRNIAIVNSLIIVATLFVINFFDSFMIKILLAFVTTFILIIILYGILGIYYRRKSGE